MFNTIFELSTNHIQESTDRWLVDTKDKPENPFVFDILGIGYLFYIADYEELIESFEGEYDFTRSELHEIFAKVKGLSPYCTHVLIDLDGPEYDFFHLFEWNDEKSDAVETTDDSTELNYAQRHAIAYQVQLGIYRGTLGSIEWELLSVPNLEDNDISHDIMMGIMNTKGWSLGIRKAEK